MWPQEEHIEGFLAQNGWFSCAASLTEATDVLEQDNNANTVLRPLFTHEHNAEDPFRSTEYGRSSRRK